MHLISSQQPLDMDTPDGLFESSSSGLLYWVLGQEWNRYAVLLSKTDKAPLFCVLSLTEAPMTFGRLNRDVWPKIKDEPIGSLNGRCGMLIRKGLRLYLKGNWGERGRNVMVGGVFFNEPTRFGKYYCDWQLMGRVDGQEVCLFDSPASPTEMATYYGSRHHACPMLQWA